MIEHRVGSSRRSRAVQTGTKLVFRPVLRYFPVRGPAARVLPMIDRAADFSPRFSQTIHKPITARTWRGEIVEPIDGPTSDGAILYLHGGAFLMGGLATHRRFVERLAYETGMTVLSVDYRQLPVGKLSDSIEDCVDAFRWMLLNGHPASRIVVAGDSAGGHLAFATVLRIRDEGLPTPAGVVGISPWLDFDHTTKLRHRNARCDAYIPAKRLSRVSRMVCGRDPEDADSPVNADLTGLPPTLIICAEGEVLRVDAELMAERLEHAGVPWTLQIWEDQVHAFPVMAGLTPESSAATSEVASFAAQAVAAPAYAAQPRHLRSVG